MNVGRKVEVSFRSRERRQCWARHMVLTSLGVQVAKPRVAEMCPPVYSQRNIVQGAGKQKRQVGAVNHVTRCYFSPQSSASLRFSMLSRHPCAGDKIQPFPFLYA